MGVVCFVVVGVGVLGLNFVFMFCVVDVVFWFFCLNGWWDNGMVGDEVEVVVGVVVG